MLALYFNRKVAKNLIIKVFRDAKILSPIEL